MNEEERTPEEWEDEFEAILDVPEQHPIKLHFYIEPIDPEDDVDADVPRYRTLQEAFEAWKRKREEQEGHQND